jgi:3-methyladenine DNA glycosylase/8-oxoguanine DNA glycosylase
MPTRRRHGTGQCGYWGRKEELEDDDEEAAKNWEEHGSVAVALLVSVASNVPRRMVTAVPDGCL